MITENKEKYLVHDLSELLKQLNHYFAQFYTISNFLVLFWRIKFDKEWNDFTLSFAIIY